MPRSAKVKLTISLTVISTILGLMLSMQYKNTQAAAKIQASVPTVDPKAQYTLEQVNKIKEENKQLETDIESLNKQLHDIEKQAGNADKDIAPEIRDDLTKYKIMAGLLSVKGPGITFSVSDSDKPASGADAVNYITHDSDLRMIVNEMMIGGAEAVAINGQRIVTTTGIVCIGPVVKINGVRVNPPFEFKAVGDTQQMLATLDFKGGVFDYLSDPNGRALTVTKPKTSPSVVIPGYAGDFNGLKK